MTIVDDDLQKFKIVHVNGCILKEGSVNILANAVHFIKTIALRTIKCRWKSSDVTLRYGLTRTDLRQIVEYLLAGNPNLPSPPVVKVLTILQYQKVHCCETFIETGTCFGETTADVSPYFKTCHTIELSPELAEKARARFFLNKRVHVHQGNSAEILDTLLERLQAPAIFWLDAHYSGGMTAGKDADPLEDECRNILVHPIKRHIILIDDARGLGFPLEQITALVKNTGGKYSVEMFNDIVRLVPI